MRPSLILAVHLELVSFCSGSCDIFNASDWLKVVVKLLALGIDAFVIGSLASS